MQIEEGRTLGDWVIVKYLGPGPLGGAYVASHRFTKQKSVLKVLPQELAADRNFLGRFEEEVEKTASIDHPHIAKTYNASFSDGLYFLVTECVVDTNQETRTLSQHFSGRYATQQEILSVAEQIAGALDYAHSFRGEGNTGFAHGNLKPNNVMIAESQNEKPVIKLVNFGLMRMVGASNVLLRSYKASLEKLSLTDTFLRSKVGQDPYPTNALEGKPYEALFASLDQNLHFLSPEQKRGDWSQPQAADVWAFGQLLYWMIAGTCSEGSWEWNTRFPSDVIGWEAIIRSCLAPDPNKRPTRLLPHLEERQSTTVRTMRASEQVDEKNVVEFAPEKQGPQRVEPLLTEMVRIQEGQYSRGSNDGCRDEMPQHKVRIADFQIDIHPVTNEQFVRFLDFLGGEKDSQNHDVIRLKDSRIKRSSGKYMIERGYGKHPVVGVTWYGAMAYAAWVGKRLPTEAEWEVACAAGLENPLYPTGESIEKKHANFFNTDTTSVKSYPPNAYGLYDMAGNVYEWCFDWYEYNYYDYSSQEPDFPKGPIQGVYRILRGGCWKSLKEDLRCAKRHRNNPGTANGTYGFRCAQTLIATQTCC